MASKALTKLNGSVPTVNMVMLLVTVGLLSWFHQRALTKLDGLALTMAGIVVQVAGIDKNEAAIDSLEKRVRVVEVAHSSP